MHRIKWVSRSLAASAFEAGFMSAAHTEADIDATLEAARRVLAELPV